MLPLDPKNPSPEPRPLRGNPDPLPPGELPLSLPATWLGGADPAGSALPPGLSAAPTMGTMSQALRRRWPVMLGVGVFGAALAAVLVWYLVPGKYITATTLEMERPPRGTYEGEFDLIAFKRTQAALFKSAPVLQRALQDPEVAGLAEERARATTPLLARKGRASYLGERSQGHQDPGATSAAYLFTTLSATFAQGQA